MPENTKSFEKQKQSESESSKGQYKHIFRSGSICCPNCRQTVNQVYELCPNCGYRLHYSHCTYCGAPMASDDLFCGECGGNSKGINCPVCGTLSFRSFCPKCNSPVDELGSEELAKAKSDPIYKKICALAEKIIVAQESIAIDNVTESKLSPDILSLLDRYRSIQMSEKDKSINATIPVSTDNREIRKHNNEASGITLSVSNINISDLSSAIDEMNALMKSLIPDPGLTPQMQRNYFSARKVAVYRKSIVKEKVGWVCNLCGCYHGSPSECARPELGGTWVYKDNEITTKTYE